MQSFNVFIEDVHSIVTRMQRPGKNRNIKKLKRGETN